VNLDASQAIPRLHAFDGAVESLPFSRWDHETEQNEVRRRDIQLLYSGFVYVEDEHAAPP
jgi:hypothetical protein